MKYTVLDSLRKENSFKIEEVPPLFKLNKSNLSVGS